MEQMFKEGSTVLKNIIKTYFDFASISRPSWARIVARGKNSAVESKWTLNDLQRRKKVSFARTYILNDIAGEKDIFVVSHETPSSFGAFHPDSNYTAVLKIEEENNEEKQYLQIWRDEQLAYTMDVAKSKEHGVIHTSNSGFTFQWNGTQLLYLAEPKRDVESFFKEPIESSHFELTDKMGNEFQWQESWGEGMTKYHHPQLCYLNVEDFKVTVKDPQPNISALQAIWGPLKSIIYAGFEEEPFRCGLYACTNRKSVIYSFNNIDDSAEPTAVISSKNMHVRSPRFDPSQRHLVYFQDECYKAHRQCSQLVLYDWESKQSKILVDIVYDPKDGEFPGIFTDQLPERCFTASGNFIIFSSVWHEKNKVIAVNLKTGSIIDLSKGDLPSQMTVLDVYTDKIIAAADSTNIEPCLMIGYLEELPDKLTVRWKYLDACAPKYVVDVDFSVHYYKPVIQNQLYPDLENQLILVRSKTMSSMEQGHPLIIFPHGGPHSCYTSTFSPRVAAFAKLGFIVCLVNYRGSIGFGQNSIKSLPGNIGVQDVSDVHLAVTEGKQLMKKLGIPFSGDVFLFGGSHGGFLNASLCAQYPGEFKACVLINPVVDVSSMTTETDIPDWNFVESGLEFSFRYPSAEEKAEMFSKSPMKNVRNVVTPTLLTLGAKDLRVPHCQGLSYYKALKSQNVEARLCVYPSDSHSLEGIAAASDSFVQATVWFFHHMGPKS